MNKDGFAPIAVILIIVVAVALLGGVWYDLKHQGPTSSSQGVNNPSTSIQTVKPRLSSQANAFYYMKVLGIQAETSTSETRWSVIKASSDGSQKTTILSTTAPATEAYFIPSKQIVIAAGVDSIFPQVNVFDLSTGQQTVLYDDSGTTATRTTLEGDTIPCGSGTISGLAASPDGSMVGVLQRDGYACYAGAQLTLFSWNGSNYEQTSGIAGTDIYADWSQAIITPDHSHIIALASDMKDGSFLSLSFLNLSDDSSTSPLSGEGTIVTSNILVNAQGTMGYFVVNNDAVFNPANGQPYHYGTNGKTIKMIDLNTFVVSTLYDAPNSLLGYVPLGVSSDGKSLLVQEDNYTPGSNSSQLLAIDTATGQARPATSMTDWGKQWFTTVAESTSTPQYGTAFVVNGNIIDTSTFSYNFIDSGIMPSVLTADTNDPFQYLGSSN